ncbi:hypothetical protein Smic_72370 [Streptomyces microflavus]|uniref:SGNH hydrolase-type esterase domain-containing protein n=1 Tax=Streptomyces microflavus TaxID=1919 RepID=A0A7J0D1Q2_STRMI|nr:hypothetical protein Smic_72370 [Streptomyces microflavus]
MSETPAPTAPLSAGRTGSRFCSPTGSRPRRGDEPGRDPARELPLRQSRRTRTPSRPDRRGAAPRAKELAPDLVTFCAGGNDIIRPGTDPDDLAERFERAVADLTGAVGTVMVTTGFDTRGVPVLRHMRGKIATYNVHLRAIADRYHCPVLDLWSLRSVQDRRAWDADRLHLSPEGHTRVALRAAQVLGHDVPADPDQPWPPQAQRSPFDARRDNIQWAREYLVPWIGRRLRGESSGDHVEAKRPDLLPL